MNLKMIIILNDSQLVVIFINDNIYAPKDIINLVQDVRLLLSRSRDLGIEYYNKLIYKDVNLMMKKAYL